MSTPAYSNNADTDTDTDTDTLSLSLPPPSFSCCACVCRSGTDLHGSLQAADVFAALSVFMSLRLALIMLPTSLAEWARCTVSFHRIEAFLALPEYNDSRSLPHDDDDSNDGDGVPAIPAALHEQLQHASTTFSSPLPNDAKVCGHDCLKLPGRCVRHGITCRVCLCHAQGLCMPSPRPSSGCVGGCWCIPCLTPFDVVCLNV